MSRISIGKADGRDVALDLDTLLRTRLLIQANSGGGKSYALRRILEQAFGKVQCIVIDPAGEFATLREKFGYVLVGEHGETPADLRSAGLVAEKLLELRASAVCDLYNLKPADRHAWLKKFLAAVMNAPKRLWHPVLFVVDEAHKFAPEKGEGESEAKEEMLSLASDGRKYGFCAIFATQRLAKLDKSAASELLNVMVGPTFMDIDLERAHKALGIVRSDWREFDAQMKTIEPGHFWALGRAISTDRILVRIGGVQTSHPEAGAAARAAEPPPAPEKVKALLPKLADLPKAAEEKARSEAELRRDIRELKAKLKVQPKQEVEKKVVDQAAIDRAIRHVGQEYQKQILYRENLIHKLSRVLGQIGELAVKKHAAEVAAVLLGPKTTPVAPVPRPVVTHSAPARPISLQSAAAINGDGDSLSAGGRKVLSAVAGYEGGLRRDQLTVLAGYKKSTRDLYVQQLVRAGYVQIAGDKIRATDAGIAALGPDFAPLPTGGDLLAYWRERLDQGERKILDAAVAQYPDEVDRETVGAEAGYKKSTRDLYIQRLARRELLEILGGGRIKASALLFD